ncbi:MAG: hypothetical protein LUO79_04240 [Methanomassiliicoccales archaeon]|nr:hypothetical protein [Methanomassiliicoccales archaeon]
MKRNLTIKAVAMVLLLAFSCLLVPAASAAVPPAQAPVWQNGETWAVGSEFDWGSDLAGPIQNLTEDLGIPGVSFDEFRLAANGSSWIVFEVTDADATEYHLNGKLAMKFNFELHLKVTAQLPDPGTYENIGLAPKSQRTIQADAVLNLAFIVDTNTVFENGTLAVKSSSIEMIGSAMASLDLKNFPDLSLLANGTVSYINYHFDVKFNADVLLNLIFDPWLDVFHFPINELESWDVESNVTLSGSVTGYLNVNGLPLSVEQMLFSNPYLEELGITSFPIDFSEISWTGPPTVMNGVLQPMTGHIGMSMECTGATTWILPLYGDLVVFTIEVNGGQNYLFYSDDIKFLAQVDANLSEVGGVPPEFQGLSMGMQPVEPVTAEQNIASISEYESTLLSGSSSGAPLDPIVAILFGVVLVAAGLVVVVAVVMRRKRI